MVKSEKGIKKVLYIFIAALIFHGLETRSNRLSELAFGRSLVT